MVFCYSRIKKNRCHLDDISINNFVAKKQNQFMRFLFFSLSSLLQMKKTLVVISAILGITTAFDVNLNNVRIKLTIALSTSYSRMLVIITLQAVSTNTLFNSQIINIYKKRLGTEFFWCCQWTGQIRLAKVHKLLL